MTTSINVSGTGSLVNALYRQSAPPEPVEGMGATILLWTDRHAATITLVSQDKKRLWVARDIATRTDTNGMSERQTYTYQRNHDAEQECYSLRKNGRWVRRGESMDSGQSLSIGQRREYRDYSF